MKIVPLTGIICGAEGAVHIDPDNIPTAAQLRAFAQKHRSVGMDDDCNDYIFVRCPGFTAQQMLYEEHWDDYLSRWLPQHIVKVRAAEESAAQS